LFSWVFFMSKEYFIERNKKLSSQLQSCNNELFANLNFYCTGYTNPSFQELKRLVSENGGKWSHYFNSAVTHVIATSVSVSRMKDFVNCKIVLPSFVVDSIDANKVLKLFSCSQQFVK
jgi:DNA repair protein REV1